jgi:hypothetical protein
MIRKNDQSAKLRSCDSMVGARRPEGTQCARLLTRTVRWSAKGAPRCAPYKRRSKNGLAPLVRALAFFGALVRVQQAFAEAKCLWCHLQQFVFGQKVECLFQAENYWWR